MNHFMKNSVNFGLIGYATPLSRKGAFSTYSLDVFDDSTVYTLGHFK